MAAPERNDRTQRIVLVAIIAIAVITAGAAIVSTMGEWNAAPAPSAMSEDEAPGPAETL